MSFFAPFFKTIYINFSLRGFSKIGQYLTFGAFFDICLFLLFSAFLYISIYLYIYISPLGRVRIIIRINNNKTLISIVIKQSKNNKINIYIIVYIHMNSTLTNMVHDYDDPIYWIVPILLGKLLFGLWIREVFFQP